MITQIYEELLKHEPIWLQRNQNGCHTKRIKCNTLLEIQLNHAQGFNHRKIGINEVVWDIDCNHSTLAHTIQDKISANLLEDKVSHIVLFGRSYHIHAFFDLGKYPTEERRNIKILMLKYYAQDFYQWCDKNGANENMMIRDFIGKHEVTGIEPKITYQFIRVPTLKDGNIHKSFLSPIRASILKDLDHRYKTPNPTKIVNPRALQGVLGANQQAYETFLAHVQTTEFKQTGMQKNNIYFKNIAIAVFRLGFNKEDTDMVFKNVARNCKPHKAHNLHTWLAWCKKQKHELEVSWNEIKRFL